MVSKSVVDEVDGGDLGGAVVGVVSNDVGAVVGRMVGAAVTGGVVFIMVGAGVDIFTHKF
jgi:hypothetical protein